MATLGECERGAGGAVKFGKPPPTPPPHDRAIAGFCAKRGRGGACFPISFPRNYFLFLMIINSNKKRNLLFLEKNKPPRPL